VVTLAKWLKQQKMTQAAFAWLIGSDQGHVSDLVRGKLFPRVKNIERIAKVTKGAVKFEDWVKR
jgi:predicted XRE-type DNA-binding protein